MSTNHARLSPSGFKALMLCPAKPAMERGRPDRSSKYADEGTNAHTLAAHCLTHNLGSVGEEPGEWLFDVPDDMLEHVDTYLQAVRDYQGDGMLFVEQAVPIGHITGEEGATGTADAVILRGDEIVVIDLKYGMGVEVNAGDTEGPNPQLALYALGALEKFGMLADFTAVRLVIVQPRVSAAPSEYVMAVEDLLQWAEDVAKPAAREAMAILSIDSADRERIENLCNPHEDACRWCKAKSDCSALERSVLDSVGAEFSDLGTPDDVRDLTPRTPEGLGAKLNAVPLIEMWCTAIRAEAERALLAGETVPGYKLVRGRKGPRAWADAAGAEKTLKSFRLKREQMYDSSLISPTSAEKLLKDEPRRWAKLQSLIKQSDGKLSVAPAEDERPAIEVKPIAEEIEAIEDAGDLI